MDTVGWEHLCFLLPTPQNKPHFIHPFPLPSSHLERESSGSHAFCSISFLFPALSLQLLPPWFFLFSKYFSHLNFNFPSFPLLPIKYLERTVCIYSFTSLPSPPTSPKWFPPLLSHSSNAHFLTFSWLTPDTLPQPRNSSYFAPNLPTLLFSLSYLGSPSTFHPPNVSFCSV